MGKQKETLIYQGICMLLFFTLVFMILFRHFTKDQYPDPQQMLDSQNDSLTKKLKTDEQIYNEIHAEPIPDQHTTDSIFTRWENETGLSRYNPKS